MSDGEKWLPVPGYEGIYEVSDLGRVRSLDRLDSLGRLRPGLELRPRVDRGGYLLIHAGGKPRRTLRVHRLVLLAFVGPPPEGADEALHGDGDPSNNALPNLRWGTRAENAADCLLHGTHHAASKTHCPSGHPYDDDNTYFYPRTNHRECRACKRAHNRARYARLRKEMAA